MACAYGGPPGTEGVGTCQAGSATCAPDGSAWLQCTGEVDPGVEDCSTPTGEACDDTIAPCAAKSLWSRRSGDASDGQFATSLALDDAADVLITGTFTGAIDFGGGAAVAKTMADLFIAVFDPNGQTRWSKTVQTNFTAPMIAADSHGNVIVAGGAVGQLDFGGGQLPSGGMLQDVAIAKFDEKGSFIFGKRFKGPMFGAIPYAMAIRPTGEIVLAGYASGTMDLGCGPLVFPGGAVGSSFIAELDPMGGCLWSTGIFGTMNVPVLGLDPTGGVFLAGGFHNTADFGGGQLANDDRGHVFLAKYDDQGNYIWALQWAAGQQAMTSGGGLVVNAAGEPTLAGAFGGGAFQSTNMDFGTGVITSGASSTPFVVSFDSLGNAKWAHAYGAGISGVGGLALDPSGNLVLSATLVGTATFGASMLSLNNGGYVAHIDAAGNALGATGYEGAGSNLYVPPRLGVDGGGNIFLAGGFETTVDLGQGPLVSAGGSDVFVANLGP